MLYPSSCCTRQDGAKSFTTGSLRGSLVWSLLTSPGCDWLNRKGQLIPRAAPQTWDVDALCVSLLVENARKVVQAWKCTTQVSLSSPISRNEGWQPSTVASISTVFFAFPICSKLVHIWMHYNLVTHALCVAHLADKRHWMLSAGAAEELN